MLRLNIINVCVPAAVARVDKRPADAGSAKGGPGIAGSVDARSLSLSLRFSVLPFSLSASLIVREMLT